MALFEQIPMEAFHLMLVFARVGSFFLVLPGFAETYVTPRIRLTLALLVSALLVPIITGLPDIPDTPFAMAMMIVPEILVGIILGTLARLVTVAIQVAGMVIAMQTGLAMAMTFDPGSGSQTALTGTFLTVLSITLIFATGLHHLMLMGIKTSYELAPIGDYLPMADAARGFTVILDQFFRLAIQLSAPFLVFGLVFYSGIGILSKLMPQVQIFFIAMPANILLGFGIFMLIIGSMMMVFLDAYARHLNNLFG